MEAYDLLIRAFECAFYDKTKLPTNPIGAKSQSMTETSRKTGQHLRTRRRFLQLRQRDLAELAGVTLRGLTDLENGRGNPTIKQLAKIAEVLGLEFTFVERSTNAPS